MFKCLIRFKGPGNAFATPISSSVTDSPYRLTKFKLKPIRHDFQNVLMLADNKCLERAAKEVISSKLPPVHTQFSDMDPGDSLQFGRKFVDQRPLSKSRGFWVVFSKRIKSSAYILPPKTISLVLRAFHVANKDTDGTSLYWIVTVLSKRLKGNCNKELFDMLANHLQNVLYQVTGAMAVEICKCLYESGYRKSDVCKNVGLKVVNSGIGVIDAIHAIFTFGLFKFRCDKIHRELENIIIEYIDQLNAIDVAKIVIGFDRSSYDPARVLNLLEFKLMKIICDISENYKNDFIIAVDRSSCVERVKETVCIVQQN